MRLELTQKNLQWQRLLAESEARERKLKEEMDEKVNCLKIS